ncbi:uncharacterized protein [Lolium perenne]|uniref:uncharacterized protein n=1 Tax=Lolium perenne TaxID=4522 RepID=UPI003A98E3AE
MERNMTLCSDSSAALLRLSFSAAFLTIAAEDLALPVPTVCAAVGVLVVLAMVEADCCCALSLTNLALAAPSRTACAARAPTHLMYYLPPSTAPFPNIVSAAAALVPSFSKIL